MATIGGSEQCRYSVRIPLSSLDLEMVSKVDVTALIPTCGSHFGVPMERVWPLSYGTPSMEEADEVGKGDFTSTSFEFLSLFRLIGGLRPDEAELDAGCGIGRMAFGLTHYLKAPGRYEGFDVSEKFIESATRRFGSMRHFRFRHVDVFNRMYNPLGKLGGDELQFPYEGETFDFGRCANVERSQGSGHEGASRLQGS